MHRERHMSPESADVSDPDPCEETLVNVVRQSQQWGTEEEGNAFFKKSQWLDAIEKYSGALEVMHICRYLKRTHEL